MSSTERRESPISFRPGKLRAAISQRARGAIADGAVVKRDLARYYLLLGRVALDDRLTRREAIWLTRAAFDRYVADAFSGDPFIPEHMDPSDELLRIVRSEIRDSELRNKNPPGVVVRVAAKIEAMTALERAALLDALDRLPLTTEEEVPDPGNWALIGVRLAEEPASGAD